MWPWSESALLREQLKAAELRASVAEAVLQAERAVAAERREKWEAAIDAANAERTEHRQSERHLVSMWLRHQKSLPLPPTPDEKAEAKEQSEESARRPIPFTDVELAMMEANRREAALIGVSAEDADKDFLKNRHMFTDD